MIPVNDLINGTFELGSGLLCWMNVWKIWKDKVVKGVYWPANALFAAWGWWTLYYYPSLNQWMSFMGGIFLVICNTTWVVLAIKYRNKK